MEYVLLGALALGLMLFVAGWLSVVAAGFQRHPVTGLFALVPGLNLVALPSLWHRVSGWVITGFVGVVLAGVAWYAGADAHLYRHARHLGVHAPDVSPAPSVVAATAAVAAVPASAEAVTHTIEIPAEARAQTAVPPAAGTEPAPAPTPAAAAVEAVSPAPPVPVAPPVVTRDLPDAALYHVVFEDIAVSKLTGREGQYVRITQYDGRRREGKILNVSADAIGLEERQEGGFITQPVKLSDIRAASIMTRKGGG